MRRAPKLDLKPLLGALADRTDDKTADRILDATVTVLVNSGFRRCTVEEIAERAGVGRSTIYRRFDGRDEIIHAVLARELRQVLTALSRSVEHIERLEDRLVEAFLAGIKVAGESPILDMIRSEPDLLLFLVEDGVPAIEIVTQIMVGQLVSAVGADTVDLERATYGAEVLFRLGMSFVLMPGSTLPLDDEDEARLALHTIFDPLLRGASS